MYADVVIESNLRHAQHRVHGEYMATVLKSDLRRTQHGACTDRGMVRSVGVGQRNQRMLGL